MSRVWNPLARPQRCLIGLGLFGLLGCAQGTDDARRMQAPAPNPFGNAPGTNPGAAGALGASAGSSATDVPVVTAPFPGDAGGTCATAASETRLSPVHLAFAFDVSGSMGKGDEPWHDKTLKWDPVVLATRAFFEDPAADGLTASLTFFPDDGDEDERCILTAYTEPDVPMTALPSDAFGSAIDAIEPQSEDDWRGGTPTAWVMRGTKAFVEGYREDHEGRFAIVLVTDGYPQGCDDADDTIEAVATVMEEARAGGVDSYVIGVANPPVDDAPDTVSDLHALATAGGTGEAFLIDTGDPALTSRAFAQAIDAIRETAFSCSLAIPEPPAGKSFDKERVAVHWTDGSGVRQSFRYDDACAQPDAWHYDDAAAPREIVLCESTCAEVVAAPDAAFEVEFACEQLFVVK